MREKIAQFIRVHGYTYKAFCLAAILFPPAAVYMAWKKPNTALPHRIGLGFVGLFSAPVLTAVGVYLVSQLVRFVSLHL